MARSIWLVYFWIWKRIWGCPLLKYCGNLSFFIARSLLWDNWRHGSATSRVSSSIKNKHSIPSKNDENFSGENSVTIHCQHQQTAEFASFTADLAIVTIPFSTLRFVKVEPYHSFSYYKRRAIRELNYISATKIGIEFKSRFWEKAGQRGGKSITDLPIRFRIIQAEILEQMDMPSFWQVILGLMRHWYGTVFQKESESSILYWIYLKSMVILCGLNLCLALLLAGASTRILREVLQLSNQDKN